ncbi:MAG TPA: S-layer homology domain-containing protein [Bacillota bacterium]|nr:S-layer homology domain-containing protein [Bacillota bacterium]
MKKRFSIVLCVLLLLSAVTICPTAGTAYAEGEASATQLPLSDTTSDGPSGEEGNPAVPEGLPAAPEEEGAGLTEGGTLPEGVTDITKGTTPSGITDNTTFSGITDGTAPPLVTDSVIPFGREEEPAEAAGTDPALAVPMALGLESDAWLTGVTVVGEPAASDGNYSFEATVTDTSEITISLEGVPDNVSYVEESLPEGFMYLGGWDWFLNFPDESPTATLTLTLENRDSLERQQISVTIRYDFQLQVTVDGAALSPSYDSDEMNSNYSMTVTGSGPHSIAIEAGDRVECASPEPGAGFVPSSDWKSWTLTFSQDALTATLILPLSSDSVEHTVRIVIGCDLQWITGLTVDGKGTALDFNADDLVYFCNAPVNKNANIPISFTLADGWTYAGIDGTAVQENDRGTAWTVPSLDGEAAIVFMFINGVETLTLDITLYYVPPPPPSSGGGGGRGPDIKVVNRPNQPNLSSDTTLIPANTQESGGQSTTRVTSKEIEALIELAEKHKEDIPDGDVDAVILIEDGDPGEISDYLVTLNAGDVNQLAESSIDSLTVSTGASDFRIRREALSGLDAGSGGNVQFRLQRIDHEGKPGIDAILTVGEKIITVVDGVYSLEIRIPYELQPGEDPNSLCIEYLRDDGTTELVTESRYDPERKTVSFFPRHLSKYGVAYRPMLFSDTTANYWANGYITFLAARDVITTPAGGRFRPDDAITRAEFINMAARAFSVANLGRRSYQSYRDVSPNQWYALAVGWSYLNNISTALSSQGNLYPNRGLARQDMATLLNNVSLSVGLRIKTEKASVLFSDAKTISPYAWDGVARMVTCGVVSEGGGGRFLPGDYCTRAQAAQSISLLMAKMR